MKTKRKIMATLIVLLFLIVPISGVQASETNNVKDNIRNILVEIADVGADGNFITEKFLLNENELFDLQNLISELMEKIQNTNDRNAINRIINTFLGGKHPVIKAMSKILFKGKLSKTRSFVISSGHSFDLNPIKKTSLKIRKTFSLWHYSSNELFKDKTLIIQPLALKLKTLKGTQLGIMTRFRGLYMHISRNLPNKSYTFFMGTAKNIMGFQMPTSDFTSQRLVET